MVLCQRCLDVPIVDCIHAVAVVVMRLGQHLHFADYIWALPLGILEPEIVPNIDSAIGSVMLSASFLALIFRIKQRVARSNLCLSCGCPKSSPIWV